jgi:dephospho-CoA kinase
VLRVGLTGGIASGKSLVAREFVARGAALVDTDVIARAVVAPGTAGADRVRAVFGDGVFAADDTLDRAALRELVFADAGRRRDLEILLHPLIRAATGAALARAGGPYVIVAVPLLIETGFAAQVDRVLVVTCRPEQQIERLMQRDGVDRERAESMVAAQALDEARLAAADDVIDNSGHIDATRAQVARLHERYLLISDNCRTPAAPAE